MFPLLLSSSLWQASLASNPATVKPDNWQNDLFLTNGADYEPFIPGPGYQPPYIFANTGWLRYKFDSDNSTSVIYRLQPTGNYTQLFLTVTDAFCVGDSFDIFIDHQYIDSTPSAPADGCLVYNRDPQQALEDPRFPSKTFPFNFTAGAQFQIFERNSPYGGGRAFFRVDSPATQCKAAWSKIRRVAQGGNAVTGTPTVTPTPTPTPTTGTATPTPTPTGIVGQIVVITEPLVTHDNAPNVCTAQGGRLLRLDTKVDVEVAYALMSQCSGEDQPHWFDDGSYSKKKSKAEDSYCTAVNGRGARVQVDCSTQLPVICNLPSF